MHFLPFLATLLLLIIIGCKKDDVTPDPPDPTPQNDIVVKDNVKVIRSETRDLLIGTDSFYVVFGSTNSQLDSIEVGDYIVSEPTDFAPQGFLRKVIERETDPERVIFKTEKGRLIDLFESGSYRIQTSLIDITRTDPFLQVDFDTIPFNGTFMDVKGTLKLFCSLDLEIDLDNNFLFISIPSTIDVELDMKSLADRSQDLQRGIAFEEKLDLAEFFFGKSNNFLKPLTFYIVGIPVSVTPAFSIEATVTSKIGSTGTVSNPKGLIQFNPYVLVENGVLSSGLEPPAHLGKDKNTMDLKMPKPVISKNSKLSFSVKPKFELIFYDKFDIPKITEHDFSGSAFVEGGIELHVTPQGCREWELNTIAKAGFGLNLRAAINFHFHKLTLLDIKKEWPVYEKEWTLACEGCSVPFSKNIEDGLVAHYGFDQGSLSDETGNYPDLQEVGDSDWRNGPFNVCYHLYLPNKSLIIPSEIFNDKEELTISFWTKTISSGTGGGNTVNWSANSYMTGINYRGDIGFIAFTEIKSNKGASLNGDWDHVVFRKKCNKASLFINGEFAGSESTYEDILTPNVYSICCGGFGAEILFDELKVYDRRLHIEEIQELYTQLD